MEAEEWWFESVAVELEVAGDASLYPATTSFCGDTGLADPEICGLLTRIKIGEGGTLCVVLVGVGTKAALKGDVLPPVLSPDLASSSSNTSRVRSQLPWTSMSLSRSRSVKRADTSEGRDFRSRSDSEEETESSRELVS